MPKEIFPSSYECDCGRQSHFFENTVKVMKAMSQKKRVRLVGAALEEHIIVFDQGGMVADAQSRPLFIPGPPGCASSP
jgi:hypothetical protein